MTRVALKQLWNRLPRVGLRRPTRTRHSCKCIFLVAGRGRVHIGGESREIAAPAVAFVPLNTQHHVEGSGNSVLQYIYVSIWPGQIPPEDGASWREACEVMIRAYEQKGYPAQLKS